MSTLENRLVKQIYGDIMTGKVYLRLLKSESESKTLLKEKLLKSLDKEDLIYVISEKDHINLLTEQAFKVLVQTDLNMIKELLKPESVGIFQYL